MPIDFYTLYHKGLRRRLFHTVAAAGAVDLGDTAQASAIAHAVTRLLGSLRHHARIEEQFFQPVIARVLPELHEVLQREHLSHEPLIDAIEASLARALVERHEEAAAALYQALHAFTAAYLPHLAREEAGMPLLRARVPEAELASVYAGFVRSRSPTEILTELRGMLPAVNAGEREQLFLRVAQLPPVVQEGAWEVAERVLSPREVAELRRRVASAA